ncbi:MAG: hypothetical protein V4617_02865 [Gemmatimonadota bacterium]
MKTPLVGIAALLVALIPCAAKAQTISPRTVPVQMGQQFDIIPSDRGPMGGIRIALDDALLDPFVNPSKATRVSSAYLSIAPHLVSQSDRRGGGKTMPLVGVYTDGTWAFGGMFAMQQLDRPQQWNTPTSERSANNRYLSALVARRFGNGYSVGLSGYSATLEAEQGIDLLYSGSDRIVQDGRSSDVRLGVTREWDEGKVWEAMVLRSSFDMTHDVHFPAGRQFVPPNTFTNIPERSENYRDQTTRVGLHTEHTRPIGAEGWKVGVLGTVNRLSHPKIPDYRINNVITVPRDPGTTWAYNAGVGLAREIGDATFGFDLIAEPMFSTTWAEAARDTVSASGTPIAKGGHTVDNKMRFDNMQFRFGFERIAPPDEKTHFGVQLGLAAYSIRYHLDQTDQVRETSRAQREQWTEWTPSIGLKLRNPRYEVRYALSFTCGGGGSCFDCVLVCGSDDVVLSSPGDGGVIAAPTDQLRFDGGRVTTQRLTVSVRFR